MTHCGDESYKWDLLFKISGCFKFSVLQSLNFINVPQRVYCERMSRGTVCCTAAAAMFSPFSSLFSVLHGEAHSFGNSYWKIDNEKLEKTSGVGT